MAEAAAGAVPLSKVEIIEMLELRVDMAARSAGGKDASGRYKKHDTARKIYMQPERLCAAAAGAIGQAASLSAHHR
jgi:hypothetical protein